MTKENVTFDRLRFRHLLLMRALGKTNSLRKAAVEMGISQPGASKLLRELEGATGQQLFQRTTRGAIATVYGLALLRRAQAILAESESVSEEFRAINDGAYARLRIGIFAVAAAPLLSSALAWLRKNAPMLPVHVEEGTAPAMMAALERRELDGILGRLGGIDQTRGPHVPIVQEPLTLVVRKGHRLLKRPRIRLSDVAREEWILPTRGALARAPLESLFASNGLPIPRVRVESSSFLVNEALLEHSDAICAFSKSLAIRLSERGSLRGLPIAVSIPVPVIALWTNGPPPFQPTLEKFLQALKAVSATHLTYSVEAHSIGDLRWGAGKGELIT